MYNFPDPWALSSMCFMELKDWGFCCCCCCLYSVVNRHGIMFHYFKFPVQNTCLQEIFIFEEQSIIMDFLNKSVAGSTLWCSGLGIQGCHCCGSRCCYGQCLIPGWATSTSMGVAKNKIKYKKLSPNVLLIRYIWTAEISISGWLVMWQEDRVAI